MVKGSGNKLLITCLIFFVFKEGINRFVGKKSGSGDKLKIGITKLTMLMERQLNYLLNARLNEKFPPFLNKGTLGLNFGLQGMQFAATSTTAENQSLSFPNYVHSISCNNDNQDIVSMGTNSALMTAKVIENSFQVLSIELISIVQAIDIMECQDKIGSESLKIFNDISKPSLPPIFIYVNYRTQWKNN